MRWKRETEEPQVRIGNCCGCRAYPVVLYKIAGLYRYRCAECYRKETGTSHYLAPLPTAEGAKP